MCMSSYNYSKSKSLVTFLILLYASSITIISHLNCIGITDHQQCSPLCQIFLHLRAHVPCTKYCITLSCASYNKTHVWPEPCISNYLTYDHWHMFYGSMQSHIFASVWYSIVPISEAWTELPTAYILFSDKEANRNVIHVILNVCTPQHHHHQRCSCHHNFHLTPHCACLAPTRRDIAPVLSCKLSQAHFQCLGRSLVYQKHVCQSSPALSIYTSAQKACGSPIHS